MGYKPIREYVFKVAQDKKQELYITLRDELIEKLKGCEATRDDSGATDLDKFIEELKRCEPTRDDIDGIATDLITAFSIWGSKFAKIDELVQAYATSVARSGDSRAKALETIKQILEL